MTRNRSGNIRMHAARRGGFTLVELVAIILLVGIMGVVVISRYTSPNAFNAQGAQDALVATIRQAQQAALGRSEVSFEIIDEANQYRFILCAADPGPDDPDCSHTATPASRKLSQTVVSKGGVLLTTGTAATADACNATATFDSSVDGLVLLFDTMGNIDTFTYDAITENNDASFNGVRLCLNATVAASVCVSPAGYAYEGACEN